MGDWESAVKTMVDELGICKIFMHGRASFSEP